MINHMYEILDAIIEQIFHKISAMPYMLREFFHIIYEESSKKWGHCLSQTKLYCIIAEFLIHKWLVPVCFFNLG